MRKTAKKKLKERFYSYIFDMKKGEENKVARRITDDVEVYVMELNEKIKKLESKYQGKMK